MKNVQTLAGILLALATSAAACSETHSFGSAHGETLLQAQAIHTSNPAQPRVEAMVYSDSGEILALGAFKALRASYPAATHLQLQNATVLPGLIDAHGHLLNLGSKLRNVDLVGTQSVREVIMRLQAAMAKRPSGAWLIGRGWDQNDWPTAKGKFPTAKQLDDAFKDQPDVPIWLERVDGHAGWANSAALAKATQSLKGNYQPQGGQILRDANGQASGVLIDSAMRYIDDALPALTAEQERALLVEALNFASRAGLTGVHDAGTSLSVYRQLERLASTDTLPVRVHAMADGDREALEFLCAHGPLKHSSGRLQMRAVKLYIDGALGSRGAALLAPYSDAHATSGLLFQSPQQFQKLVKRAAACGIQIATHAIGDRGNRVVLEAYAQLDAHVRSAQRMRIEHAQIVAPEDLSQFAKLGLIASMQPTHATSDMPWVRTRIGIERMEAAYAWASLIEQNVPLALGSDFPVEEVNPFFGLFAAITRTDQQGEPRGGWLPKQRLTRAQALHGFTMGAAFASFSERQIGSLEVGKRADFVVIDRDIMEEPEAKIPHTKVLRTVIDGQTVYGD